MRAVKAEDGPNGLRRVRETGRCGAGTPLTRSRTWQVMGSFGMLGVTAGRSEEASLDWDSDWLRLSMFAVYDGRIRREEDEGCSCLQELSYLAKRDLKIMLGRLPLLLLVTGDSKGPARATFNVPGLKLSITIHNSQFTSYVRPSSNTCDSLSLYRTTLQ